MKDGQAKYNDIGNKKDEKKPEENLSGAVEKENTSPQQELKPASNSGFPQVAQLFNQTLEVIRNQKHHTLEEKATVWLKNTGLEMMRDLEREFYQVRALLVFLGNLLQHG